LGLIEQVFVNILTEHTREADSWMEETYLPVAIREYFNSALFKYVANSTKMHFNRNKTVKYSWRQLDARGGHTAVKLSTQY
jgi:hypothetical protein